MHYIHSTYILCVQLHVPYRTRSTLQRISRKTNTVKQHFFERLVTDLDYISKLQGYIFFSQHYTQEATDNFDPHGKLLGSNYIFPIPIDAWSPKIPIIGLALGEVQNALNQ